MILNYKYWQPCLHLYPCVIDHHHFQLMSRAQFLTHTYLVCLRAREAYSLKIIYLSHIYKLNKLTQINDVSLALSV